MSDLGCYPHSQFWKIFKYVEKKKKERKKKKVKSLVLQLSLQIQMLLKYAIYQKLRENFWNKYWKPCSCTKEYFFYPLCSPMQIIISVNRHTFHYSQYSVTLRCSVNSPCQFSKNCFFLHVYLYAVSVTSFCIIMQACPSEMLRHTNKIYRESFLCFNSLWCKYNDERYLKVKLKTKKQTNKLFLSSLLKR